METSVEYLQVALKERALSDDEMRLLEELCNSIIIRLEEEACDAIVKDDFGQAATLAERLADLTRNARAANYTVRGKMAHALPDKSIQVGGWNIETQWSKKRKNWENERLVKMVAASEIGPDNLGLSNARMLTEDGEVIALSLEDFTEILTKSVLDSMHVDYWKIKPLQQRFGKTFDVDQFCENKWTEPTVRIQPIMQDEREE